MLAQIHLPKKLPMLATLDLYNNLLTELDLSGVDLGKLAVLSLGQNWLTELKCEKNLASLPEIYVRNTCLTQKTTV